MSRRVLRAVMVVVAMAFAGGPPGEVSAQTVRIEFRMIDRSMSAEQAEQTRPPVQSEILYGMSDKRPYLVEKEVLLSAADMCSAEVGYDQRTGEPVVSFRFTHDGARKFAQATTKNVGHPFAIVIDDEVASAPVIREPILSGSGQIAGHFTAGQANDLVNRIRASAAAKC